MQVQKQELRERILEVAENEFVNKGFKGASMRVIARKSHTTLGNLYNYFQSKEHLLDEVIGSFIIEIERVFKNHIEEEVAINDFEEMNKAILNYDMDSVGYGIFLSKKFVILMEGVEGTKYEYFKEEFLYKCKEHFLWHINNKDRNNDFVEIVTSSFISGVLFIAKRNKDITKAKEELIKLYQFVCSGIISRLK